MISTATALIEAVTEAIFDDESMVFAKTILDNRNEMTQDDFAKAIYMYSGIIASSAVDKATKILLTETQLKELMDTIGELDSLRNEVLNG